MPYPDCPAIYSHQIDLCIVPYFESVFRASRICNQYDPVFYGTYLLSTMAQSLGYQVIQSSHYDRFSFVNLQKIL